MRLTFFGLMFFLCAMIACSQPSVPENAEEGDPLDKKTHALTPTTGPYFYFSISADNRTCSKPACGGYYVSAPHIPYIRCPDGRWLERCYVAEVDWSSLRLYSGQETKLRTQASRVLVYGYLYNKSFTSGYYGVLKAKQAWKAPTTKTPSGYFYNVVGSGTSMTITIVNYEDWSSRLNSLNFSSTNATQEQMDAVRSAARYEATPFAGRLATLSSTSSSLQLKATQFYLPVKAVECEDNWDCSLSVYRYEVYSRRACYCLLCPQPVSSFLEKTYRDGWNQHCSSWAQQNGCPVPTCLQPPSFACVKNRCQSTGPQVFRR